MRQRAPDLGGAENATERRVTEERRCGRRKSRMPTFRIRSEISRDYPLNLSISLSGGKETNQDSPSNGE